MPAPRRLAARTDAQVLELAASLKRENPTRTATQVARILRTATGWAPSESTLLRHFHRLDLTGPGAGETRRCSVGSRPPTPTSCGAAMGSTAPPMLLQQERVIRKSTAG